MSPIFIAGIGTGVGKTVVSSVVVEALSADYWKPVQAGSLEFTDSDLVSELTNCIVYPEAYRLKNPLSPHISAFMDGIEVNLEKLILPTTSSALVIEGAGGLLVPLNRKNFVIDLIPHFKASVILVSRHYLGSINHTLLSVEALKVREADILGVVFIGTPLPDTEEIILESTGLQAIGRIDEEPEINRDVIVKYAKHIKSALKGVMNG